MKRTPLTRRTRLERGGPVKRGRGKRFAGYTPNQGFQDFVRRQPCLLREKATHSCGPSEFAHIKSRGSGGGDEGNGAPLCAMAHRLSPLSLHTLGERDFEAKWSLKRGAIRAAAARLWHAYQEEER